MALNRSRRMFLMAQEGRTQHAWEIDLADRMSMALIPSFESTKGTTYFERELAIRGYRQLNNDLEITAKIVQDTALTIETNNGTQKNRIQINEVGTSKNENMANKCCWKNYFSPDDPLKTIINRTVNVKDVASEKYSEIDIAPPESKSSYYVKENVKDMATIIINCKKTTTNQKNFPADENCTEEIYEMDLISENNTSESEYLPSDDKNSESTDCNSSDNEQKQIGENIASKDVVHIRESSGNHIKLKSRLESKINPRSLSYPNESFSAEDKLDPIQIMNPNDSDSKEGSEIFSSEKIGLSKSNVKIKVISNIKVIPPYKSNNFESTRKADCVVAPAESTTESFGNTQNSTNLVKICSAKINTAGKRVRDKKHSCYYCHKMALHISRHMEIKHEQEIDVARALAFPKNSCKRKEIFTEITRAGDFHHNCEVISLKQGELILVRRPTMNEVHFNKYTDYGPCPKCLGFLLKKNMWHHLNTKCLKKAPTDQFEDTEQANRHVIAESNAIMSNVFGPEFSSDYKKYIVDTLRNDDAGDCCRDDNLILKFGAMQFEKYGTTQAEFIRQNMRQLARLIMVVREMTSQSCKLIDLLIPQKFDLLVQGVKKLCQSHQNDSTKRPEFITPSLALKLGHSLRKCAHIERGVALRQENLPRNQSLLAFCSIMDLEWQIRVSSNALATLFKRKLNAGQLLPITNDLLKCNHYIKTEMNQALIKLMKSPSAEHWSRLAKLVLCRIILFNKRRAGEASKMTLEQYTTRPLWTEETNQELKIALSSYEAKLAERHVIVNIIGKRGRFVPVLLTPETKMGIDILISHRNEKVGINSENNYIFARSSLALTHMRGPDVLRGIIGEIGELEKPELITSTKLRKYVATVCQVFDLSENESDWLARHLGHDIRVHREFYRLHEDVVELTKVSRLLMAVDQGEASKFAGKPLKDIKLTELPSIEEEEEEDNEEDDDLHGIEQDISTNGILTPEIHENITNDAVSQRESLSRSLQKKSAKKVPIQGNKQSTKVPWEASDKKAVLEYFRTQIKHEIVPGKADCEACQAKFTSLKNRKWTDIKFCVKNQVAKIKNMKKLNKTAKVKASQKVCFKTKTPSLGFADTAEGVFKLGPPFLRKYSTFAKIFVEGGLFLIHFLADAVYIVFISVSLTKLFSAYFPECESWGNYIFKLILLVPLLICGQVRELKHLVPFSLIANGMLVVTFGITGYYMFSGITEIQIKDRNLATGLTGIPSFFSTVLFSMEGIGTIMPVENSMITPNFIGCPGVLNSAMTIIITLYTSIGFLGYYKFGEMTAATITANLPSGDIAAQVCQAAIATAVFFSFMLIFYVPVDIAWSKIRHRISEAHHNVAQIILRSGLIILATGIAIAGGENLGTLIDLIGALLLSTLGLFVPALLDILVDWEDGWGVFHWRLIKNILIMLLAIFGLVSGSFYAFHET